MGNAKIGMKVGGLQMGTNLTLLAGICDRAGEANTRHFRNALTARGLTIRPGTHPIVPIMLGDAVLAHRFSL